MRSSNTCHSATWRRRVRAGLFLLSITLFGQPLLAIDPNRAVSQYVHDRWGPEQGLPRGPVYAITQTPDGYLWIGSEAGLLRFDGFNFLQVKDPTGAFNIDSVLGLAPDNEGNLWVRLQGPMLLRYRDGAFESPPLDEKWKYAFIGAMSRTSQGSLLFSKMEQGAFTHRNGNFEMLADASALPRSPVMALAQMGEGDIWMGTRDAGLFRLRDMQAQPVTEGLPDLKVNCLLPDNRGNLWIGTDAGVVRWDGTKLNPVGFPELRQVRALAMVIDRDNNVWVGTNSHGLLRVNDRSVSPLYELGATAAVTAVFEDREGNLWFGSANGLERLRDSPFVTYSISEGLPSDRNGPVFVDSNGRAWFAPADGGLHWMADDKHGNVTQLGLNKDVVYSIAGREGELWIGRQRGGLTRLRVDRGSFEGRTYSMADGLAQNSVYAVHVSRDGTVWAGTLSGGISRFSNGTFKTYTVVDGLPSNTVNAVLEDAHGTIWVATPGGLGEFSEGRWRAYTAQNGLPADHVNSLFEDSKQMLWVGTANGVAYYSAGAIHIPPARPSSLKEQILGITDDHYGSLWVATYSHVLRVNREKLQRGTLTNADLREFGLADGLHATEGVKRHRSVFTDARGRVWFSLNQGLSVVNPMRLIESSVPALAHIQSVLADGVGVALKDPLRIPSGMKRITFGFTGLSLSVPERVRFKFLLDGYDKEWSEPTGVREKEYTNLDPGEYRFRVASMNPDGVWSPQEATIAFEIPPAFWQTWLFQLVVAFLAAAAIAAFFRYRLHHVTQQLNIRFDERLGERTRIAQDLHDTLLQGFLSASMQLHVAADQLSEKSPVKGKLNHILQLMAKVTEEGRNAVQGLRSFEGPGQDLEQAFSRIQQEVTISDDVRFKVIVEGRPRPLHPIIRDEAYRIGREALMNAFRHARAKKVEVELDYSASHLRVLVRDDGCGIDPEVLASGRDGHWGLSGMRERAERIGAQLNLWSREGAGTEVELSVPGSIAFQLQGTGRGTWFRRFVRRPKMRRAGSNG